MGLVVDVRAYAVVRPEGEVPGLGARLAAMDAAGVDMQAVAAAHRHVPTGYGRARPGHEAAMFNERIATLVGRAPDRLVGVGAVALGHPDVAADQLRRAVDDYDFRGVEMCAGPAGWELADPAFDGFWRMAEMLGIVVFLRPEGCRPSGGSVQGGRVTGLGDVLQRFPALIVCSAPDGVVEGPRPQTPRWYVDSAVPDGGELRRLVDAAGAQHVLRGSGYPFLDAAPLGELELTPEERDMIDGGTASALLRLDGLGRIRHQWS